MNRIIKYTCPTPGETTKDERNISRKLIIIDMKTRVLKKYLREFLNEMSINLENFAVYMCIMPIATQIYCRTLRETEWI